MSEENKANRLAYEKSPYLLQHANNPVDWYPWGDEAFAKAAEEDKPIFLSIGYSSCHWCHVMEEETFVDPEIAEMMNQTFINIKVDREEHPEVDSIYMEFAQALMSSAGGWPLNVVLTPDLKPFFAVTYLPPRASKGLIGMDQFTTQIQMLWSSEERAMLMTQADKIVQLFENAAQFQGDVLPDKETLDNSVQMLFDIADPVYGGIKGEPKFPMGYQADLLLQQAKAKEDSRSLFFVELTLQMMARGGIYDQLGGGFSRYCVDEQWHIPHFEKMLYDNAILAKTYLEAYKLSKKPLFEQVCRETLDYCLRELKGEGGFYAAEDADIQGKEGKFYTWNPKQIAEALPEEDVDLFMGYFGMTAEGNFEGENVLHVAFDPKEIAEKLHVSETELTQKITAMKTIVAKKRKEREQPFKDDKVLTSWNGLMIDVLARAGACLGDETYTLAARETADWIRDVLFVDGELLRRFRDGDARFSANLDDYAFLIRGLLTLFEMGQGTKYLEWALTLCEKVETLFKISEGAYYQTKEDPHLLIRKCEFYDGAEPSGNAVHCENLIRLFQLTQEERYLKGAEDILKAAKSFIDAFPPGACYHLISLQRYLDEKAPLIVVAYDKEKTHAEPLQKALSEIFCPHAMMVHKYFEDEQLTQLVPSLACQGCKDEATTVYICHGVQCDPPVTELEQALEAIRHL